MSDDVLTMGLAGLLDALQPRPEPPPPPPPDLDAIRAEGYAAGLAEGEACATAALAPLRDRMAKAADALRAATTVDGEALRPLLAALVRQLAEAVLLTELRGDPAVLSALADAALATIIPGVPATLAAHPDTLAALAPHLPPGLATAADATLEPDRISVSGADFIIDTSLADRLADLMGTRG